MRTQGTGATRLTFIVATIVAAIAAWLPAIPAHAVGVKITVNNAACFTSGALTPPSTTPLTVTLATTTPLTCGQVTIASKPGTAGAQVAAIGSGQNQLVIRNAVITNNGATAATVKIEATHRFTLTAVPTNRSYGITLSASFSRKNASGILILAGNNSITKSGSFTYSTGSPGTIGPKSFSVPTAGSTTQNTVPIPGFSATATGACASCLAREDLGTTLSVVLNNQKDVVTIPGGDVTVAGDGGDGFVNAVIASHTVAARLQQNTPIARINPFDNGFLTVELLCNPDFPCGNVVLNDPLFPLLFGPAGARPKSVKSKDVNGDGSVDLQLKFAQQDTGITCSDTEATVSGAINFTNFPDFPFDAIVGFYTDPLLCPPTP